MTRSDPPLARPAPARGLALRRGACSPVVRRRRRRAQPLSWITALAGALAATSARAASPAPARLEWIRGESAESCPSGAWAAAEVRRRLGRDPFSIDGERSIEVTLQRTRGGWKGEVRDRPSSSAAAASRAFTSADPSCAPLAEALALAVTLTLDPELSRERAATPTAPSSPASSASISPLPPKDAAAPPGSPAAEGAKDPPSGAPPPEPAPSPPATSSSSPSAPPLSPSLPPSASASTRAQPSSISDAAPAVSPRASEPVRAEPPRVAIALGGGALVGLLPHTALALHLSARARVASFLSIEAATLFLADNTTPENNLTFGLTAGRLGACADLTSGARGAVMICPDLLLGALHVIVGDQNLAASGVVPWGAAAVDLEGDLAVVGRLQIGVRGGFIIPFAPYRLYSSEHNFPLFRQRQLALEGLLSVGVHFP